MAQPDLLRRLLLVAGSGVILKGIFPAWAQSLSSGPLGRKRIPTAADSQLIASLQARQSGVLFFENFSNENTFSQNWKVFTDDRSDLLGCRTADSLHTSAEGLEIRTIPAQRCHASWSTGQIISRRSFKFGFFEAYMRIANDKGVDNAFWLTTENGTNDGSGDEFEIDIVEAMYPNDVHMTLHRHNLVRHQDAGELGFDHRASKALADGYNYYSALWTEKSITFGFNGNALGVIETDGAISGPAYIRLSTALGQHFGGKPPDNPAGLAMHVKHVRVLSV